MPVDRSTIDKRKKPKPRPRTLPGVVRLGGADLPAPPEYTYRTTGPGLVTVQGREGLSHEATSAPQRRPPLTYTDVFNENRAAAAAADREIARRRAQAAATLSQWSPAHKTPAQRAKQQRLADILTLGAGPLKPSIVPPLRTPPNLFQRLGLNPGADMRDAASRPPLYESIIAPGRTTRITPEMQALGEQAAYHGKPPAKDVAGARSYITRGADPSEITMRGLRAQQAGIPLGDLARPVIDAAHTLDPGERQNLFEGFPQFDQPVTPTQRSGLADLARKQGGAVPENATIADYYKAIYGEKPSGWRGLYENLPRDFLMTPVYAATGGYAVGAAVKRAALLGDYSDLREIAAQQADIVRHPLAFAQRNPFQAGLVLAGGAKLAGRGAAITRNLSGAPLAAAERAVPLLDPETRAPLPPVGGEVPTLRRGTLSTRNLTTRGAQKLSDAILARSVPLQKRAVMKNVLLDARAQARAELNRERAPAIKEFQEARKGVTRAQAQRINENEARGITPGQHAAYRGQEPPTLAEHLSPAEERYHAALVRFENEDVTRLQRMGLLSDFAARRRAYLPAIKVAERAGDENAARFVALDQQVRDLQKHLEDHPTAQVHDDIQRLSAQRDASLAQFQSQHLLAGGQTPTYVPEKPVKVVQSAFGRNAGGGAGTSALRRRVKPPKSSGPYQARLFEHGTYKPVTDQMILAERALPARVEQEYRFIAEVSNPERGIVKRAEPGQEIPPGYVLQRVRSQDNPLANEIEATTGAAPATTPLQSLLSTFDRDRINNAALTGRAPTVPKGRGEYRLWPTSVYQQIAEMRSLNPPTGRGAIAATKTGQVLRNALLYSRPAYPVTNLVSNIIQSGLVAGTGPSSYAQARGENLPVPARVQDVGTAAVNFDAPGASSLRNAWEDRGSTIGGVGRVAGHVPARYMQAIYRASVDMENWTRRATYLSKALPEAIKAAHPEYNAIQRFAASWRPADAAVKRVLDDMAHGRTPEARASAQRAVRVVNQALGDFAAMGDHRNLGVVVPFWRWTNFVRILMTETLPFHYPGRALLLYRLGALGQVAQHQLGPLTPSLQGAIPFGQGTISTQRINPFATLGQNVIPPQGETAIDPRHALANVTPFGQIGYTLLAREDPVTGYTLRNQYGLPIHGSDYARVLGAQAVDLLPPARALAPLYGGGQTSAPDTSINLPWLTQQGPQRSGPTQPSQPLGLTLLNQVAPVSFRKVDLAQMAQQGDKKLKTQLAAAFKAHASRDVESIMRRLADERGVDLSVATPERTKLINDAIAEWRATRR